MAVVVSYNVNGIRAAWRKGWLEWLDVVRPDVICLQEVRALPEQIDLSVLERLGYAHHWFPAERKGYSGVAILSRQQPRDVVVGCGVAAHDREGRVIRADFDHWSAMSIYVPSGAGRPERHAAKMDFLAAVYDYLEGLLPTQPNIIVGGDYNIAHQQIDLHDPVSNMNRSGFLPKERAWMDAMLKCGFVDALRVFNPEPHLYTWWSAKGKARNLGWRLDYQLVSNALKTKLQRAVILRQAGYSDHSPVLLEFQTG